MTAMTTNADFFSSLYETAPQSLPDDFDAIVTRLVASKGDKVVSGDQALQSVMINYLLSSPENATSGQSLASYVAGIKQKSVDAFTAAFPGVNLDVLIDEAKRSGHDVQVLG
jgi:hypothetical protein